MAELSRSFHLPEPEIKRSYACRAELPGPSSDKRPVRRTVVVMGSPDLDPILAGDRLMATGLDTTFALLAETANEAAIGSLIPALDSPRQAIREVALRTTLKRRSPLGRHAVVARLDQLDEPSRRIVREYRVRMVSALRDALLSNDRRLFANACEAVLWFREYDLVAALITAAEDGANPQAELAVETLLALVEQLNEEVTRPRDYSQRRDPQMVCRHVVETFEGAVSRYGQHQRRELCEALLVLAKRDNQTLLGILNDPRDPTYLALIEVLTHSGRSGVIRLLLSFIVAPRTPSVILSVIAHRKDVPFVRKLLGLVSPSPSTVVTQNLKRMESIGWLGDGIFPIDTLTGAEHASLVAMVMASGMKRLATFAFVEFMLENGHVEGRRAAAKALAEYHGADANDLCLRRLADTDPIVQARLAEQLRSRGIRGAMARLVEMVDSSHDVVREAARAQLEEFRLERFLAAFDLLPDEVRQSTGLLVKKIDRRAIAGLAKELVARARSRRLRGIAAARALQAAVELEQELIELLEDEDHMVRTEAAGALGDCQSPAAEEALMRVLDDRSVTVRLAARESLKHMADRAGGSRCVGPASAEPSLSRGDMP